MLPESIRNLLAMIEIGHVHGWLKICILADVPRLDLQHSSMGAKG